MKNLPNLTEILINTFSTLINQFVDFVPRLISAIVVLLIGYFVAKMAALVVKQVLGRAGFDKIGDKLNEISIVKQLKTEIKLSEIVAKVLYYFILLVFITASTETLGVAAITSLVLSLVNFIPQVIAAAIMLQLGVLVADALKNTVITLCKSFNVPSGKLIGNVVFFFFLIITVISSLGQAGINTELLGVQLQFIDRRSNFAFAVGYGLASRDIVSNIIASFYSKNRYKEGQIIQVNGVKGEILALDSTTVTLKTDSTEVVLPLQMLQNQQVEVFS